MSVFVINVKHVSNLQLNREWSLIFVLFYFFDLYILAHLTLPLSLRTSETNYLNEAYQFYAAIRGRAYYSRAIKEDRPDLMVKKLRYYARFIVVCLLLKKMKLVRELIVELDKQIQEYTTT